MKQFETQAIRAQMAQTDANEHSAPLYLTSSFTFENAETGAALFAGELEGNLYSRFSNPNTDEFAQKLALLEGGETAVATATGMAAVFVCFAALLKAGDNIVATSSIFGNTTHILTDILPKWGISCTFVDINSPNEFESAIAENTHLFYVETPSNPTLSLVDIAALAANCKSKNCLLVVDNCFATPYLQQPIKWGADIVIHSATKFIDGQGRVMGGAIVGRETEIKKCYDFIRRTGPSLSPFNAWVLSKSLETLAVRMDKHCENALKVATFLEQHPDIETVVYPFLPSYPQFELAKKQMRHGGGLVAAIITGGKARGAKFLNALTLHSLTANLGDTRSIATHPASTTHSKLSSDQRLAVGIADGLIRFSVGLEHIDDILADIDSALINSRL